MWWGGSEGGQGGSPPPDPPKEQGDGSQGEDPAVIRQELGDLKDQFDEQQALIGQLKDMLKKKEATLSGREREVQDYASRLARMKPKLGRRVSSKSKQSPARSEHSESGESSGAGLAASVQVDVSDTEQLPSAAPPSAEERLAPPVPEEEVVIPPIHAEGRVVEEKRLSSSESSSRAKILLLRKQLHENRLKFQRQQKDDEKVAMEEMKHRIERLRAEVEQRDDMIQALQEGRGPSQEEPSMQKLYQQIVYKDNTILELSQKVTHLEGIIQEHVEQLSEKDKIIEARTEAVSLIAKAQDEKSLKTLEELEEVRYQMKKMQEDFILKEQELTAERDALSKELKDKVKKINQLEDNGRRLENLRFEMSTRNAELQEKIVGLQSDTKTLREQSEAERQAYLEKDSLIQELKQKLVKAEAHGMKKLKALEKQLRGIKQDGNAGEKILELQNSIAELEEEKGNLQLKLVDFDDLKVTNEKLTSTRNKLEDHIKQLNCDLDSQLSAITLLETEKIKLVEGINERENKIYDLESELSGLKTNMEEIKQAKVTLDLRLCEVEEQRDTAEKMKMELENQMSESGRVPVEQLIAEKGSLEESLQSMMKEREEWEQKYLGQIETVQECERNAKSAMEERDVKVRECRRLMNILTDKENAIATLSIQIDKHDVVVAGVENKVKLASEENEKLHEEFNNLNKNYQDQLHNLEVAHGTIAEMEDKLKVSTTELKSKDDELSAAQSSMETLNRSLNERNITVQNLVGEVSALQDEVKLKERSVNDLINKLERLESQINECEKEIEKLCTTLASKDDQLSAKDMELESLKKDLTNSSRQLETTKASIECELDALSAMLSDSKNQLESSQLDLQMKAKEIHNNQIMISRFEQEVCDKNQTLDELKLKCQELDGRLSSSSVTLSHKESLIMKLQNEIEEKMLTIENIQRQQSSLEQKIHDKEEENKYLSDEKMRLEDECHEKMGSIDSLNNALSEKIECITNLEDSMGSYKSELDNKVSEVEKWQSEALEKSGQVSALMLQLESIQSDSGSKDTLVANLQAQIVQNQEQISSLQNRLQETEVILTENQRNLAQTQQQLVDTQNILTEKQEQFTRLKDEYDTNESQLKETSLQYEKVTALATHFEEELRKKSTNLEAAEKQMASREESSIRELSNVQHDIEHLRSEVTRLEGELHSSKEAASTSQAETLQLQEHSKVIQVELDVCKKELGLKSEEVNSLHQNLSELQYQTSTLQEQLTQAVSYHEQYQQQINSLQEQLSQALNLKQQSDSEIAALSVTQQQRISQLEGELLTVTQVRDQLQAELEKSSHELQNQLCIIDEQKANVQNLFEQSSTKDCEIQALQNSISLLQNTEQELRSHVKELEEEKAQVSASSKVLESFDLGTSDVGLKSDIDSEVKTLRDELAKALDQSKFLEEECDDLRGDANTLKQQLQDARQTITHLQTSLATQSQSSGSPGGWGDWGEVDLGAPTPASEEVPRQSSSLVTSLQKSLADKDEMLTMMQDQLKETLQEINTINEEKKIIEKQKQSVETNLAQQVESWKEEKEELNRLRLEAENVVSLHGALDDEKKKIASLESDLLEKQQVIEGLNQQLIQMKTYEQSLVQEHSQEASITDSVVVSDKSVVQEEIVTSQAHTVQQEGSNLFAAVQWPQTGNEAAANWFDQQVVGNEAPVADREQTTSVQSSSTSVEQAQTQDPVSWFDQQGQVEETPPGASDHDSVAQDPANWFDEQHSSGDTAAVTEEVTATQSYEQEKDSQEQESVNVEELQYKLSWYEEQWATWTAHYNQLQVSYQESEQKVTLLSEQLQALQETEEQETVVGVDGLSKEETKSGHGETDLALSSQSHEIQIKLTEAEKALECLKEENQLLQGEARQVSELKAQLEILQARTEDPTRLQKVEAEVDHLRGFETQVYELQSQVQALQHQCTAMQNKLSEAETEVSRLREVEVLYGELQSCIQESETKREGSKSRVQELELMVQSAESEIARLRNEIEVLTQAEQASGANRDELQDTELTEDVSEYRNQILSLQNEVDKCQSESDYFKAEMARLENENQNMGDEMARARSDLQRLEQENSQLRSELEVFEGELDRMRTSCEMYEAENNRVRGDYEALSQASQMTEAEKESLESEVQRITAQNMTLSADSEHLRDEIQRLTEVSTSAETEIVRLQSEIERFKTLDHQYNNLESKYNELQAQVTSMESAQSSKLSESEPHSLVVEEVDWSAEGQIEDEHRQRSSSVDLKYQEEIDDLKEKVIAIEKEKNTIYDELQAAKLKSGKMLQKLKLTQSKNEALTKEIQKLKAKAGGFSDLDQALEEEWKAQVTKAETERDEFKQKLDEVENEKENLLTQIDVLTAAQEEYIEMKEDQDTTIKLLKARNKEVEGQLQALEWKISELEEVVEQQQQSGEGVQEPIVPSRSSVERESSPLSSESQVSLKEVEALKEQVASLQREVKILRSENERLQTAAKELEEAVESLSQENDAFQSVIEGLKDAKAKAESDSSNYKSVYIEMHNEHESLKKEKEKTNEELRELSYAHDTLKAAYNSMYSEYNDLRDVCDSHKHDVGILKGERDRFLEEINSMKNQLEALHEEEEEETIRALQDECFNLREQNNLLHEENTALEVKTEDAVEKASRLENTLEQNVEMQKLLQDELMKKSEEITFHTATIEDQDRQMSYLKAEMAAMKTKLSQQDQAEESTLETTQKLEAEVEQLLEKNQQLQLQVETAEASLARLAGGKPEGGDAAYSSPAPAVAELEAALASLHLRDLRCQQLSLEITKLLEERDALQLKLSASLRQTQELTRELSLSHQLPAPVAPEPSLDQKLAELRELNDSLEQKALVSLQGAASAATMGRRITVGGLQSPPIFTPHTAPPTPTATRHADYTLTREAQGTSSTLIDWIMGKSTPRVLHV